MGHGVLTFLGSLFVYPDAVSFEPSRHFGLLGQQKSPQSQ